VKFLTSYLYFIISSIMRLQYDDAAIM